MTFANPEYLYYLIIVLMLCLIIVYSVLRGQKRLSMFANKLTLKKITRGYFRPLRIARLAAFIISLVFIVLMLARPQKGLVETTDSERGIEAVIMVDVSNSMLSADVTPNRLERAKLLLNSLIDDMHGDRIALGIFAGEAYLQLPITADRQAAKEIMSSLSPSMISMQGTHIAAALDIANRAFSDRKDADKAIILITDGENHEGDIEAASEQILSDGRKLFILGIGTAEGATIPTSNGPLQDEEGNVVITRLNENILRDIAQKADGEYIHVDNTLSAQKQLKSHLEKLQKSNDASKYTVYDERFQIFGIIALIMLVLSLFLPDYFYKKRRRAFVSLLIPFLLFTFSTPMQAQTATWRNLHSANRQFDKGNYDEALKRYEKILSKNPTNSRVQYNAANANLAKGDAQKAMELYSAALQTEQDPNVKSKAYHNMGVISQTAALDADEETRQKLLREAIDHYKNALRNNPADDAARYNLALCKKQLKENKNDNSKNNENQKQPEPKPQPQPEKQNDEQKQENKNNTATQQLLNLTRQSEQKTREKINSAKPKTPSKEKNW